ncbi:IclR family transcriptional regulator [Consotaella aegiceratis]|uniref:IclR family transcriptional regulator n=1 Tax=Consotaella aegiceratis TaxID=3097961 RepID=UPI002F3F76C6
MDDATRKSNTLFVGSLEKGMRVLSVFGSQHPELSLTELVALTGLDKSAVQRLANTLHLTGYLEKDPDTRRFRPSLKCLELGAGYLCSDPLPQLAMPKLIELSRALGERVNAARLDGTDIVYVIRIPTQLTNFAAMLVGRRITALTTSSGRILIANFDAQRRRQAIESWPITATTPKTTLDRRVIADEIEEAAASGYGMTVSQNIMNEIGISAPIYSTAGEPVATVQCSVSSLKWSVERVRTKIAPALMEVANSIQVPR